MVSFYYLITILALGTSMAFGLLSILSYLFKKGKNVYLLHGALCLSAVLFVLLDAGSLFAPAKELSTGNTDLKRLFNFTFLALLPWFIFSYTSGKKPLIPVAISSLISCGFVFSLVAPLATLRSTWLIVGTGLLIATIVYSIYAARIQFRRGQKLKARWLFLAIGSFIFCNVLGAFDLIRNNYSQAHWDAILFPISLCPIAFSLIMGISLQLSPAQAVEVPKIHGLRESRWESLLEQIQLIVVNTDIAGRVQYINPFGLNVLGYNKTELLDTNWSDHCLQVAATRNMPVNNEQPGHHVSPYNYRNTVFTKSGKSKTVKWTSDLLYDEKGDLIGKMNIGFDVSGHEDALRQIQELKAELEKEAITINDDATPASSNQEVIGNSRPFIYAIQKCKQVAPTNASVLLLGETGVGKEAFADLIQATSLRSNLPFVKVNCGALPAELIEDELFGHEKGAFTGAIQSRIGRFEKANGGTIFLDEIGELPLVLQPKLLRVLQSGDFERIGGHQTIKVDVRVIAATNSDLEKEIRENRFRDDLFYRLNVFPITIPPLRKRTSDIPLLIQHFIEKKSKEHGKSFENISKADMSRLCEYEWPGNIRELKNVIERSVISSAHHTLKLEWFNEVVERSNQPASTESLEQMETAYIIKVLEECKWKINGENGAAEKLVMHPNTLRSRMKKLKISAPWKQDGQIS